MRDTSFDLDLLARELAAGQGQSWHEMCDFPGYKRNVWREAARSEVAERMPGAVVEPLPPRYDGRDGGWLVRLP
jgi:hypothetical protein